MPQPPNPQEITPERILRMRTLADELSEILAMVKPSPGDKIKVILFRKSGKYYTEEEWRVPMREAYGPHCMQFSPDFRRIDDGKILVPSNHWGFPVLL